MCYTGAMRTDLLRTIARELPGIVRQLESLDPALYGAALARLRDFSQMSEPWRDQSAGVSRRGLLRRAGATFVALSLKRDD